MTNEMRQILEQVWTANYRKQMSLSNVIKTSCDALRKDKLGAGAMYAELIGDGGKNKATRSKFIDRLFHHLNWVRYNGDDKITVIEFVRVSPTEMDKYTKMIAEYHLYDEENPSDTTAIKIENCSNHIDREIDEPLMTKFKHASGYVQELKVLDSEGKPVTKKATVAFVPREKAVWGYTTEVKNAFICALEDLENEK